MLKKTAIFILFLALSSILIDLSAVIFSSKLRYFLYKEISYQYLADNITKGTKTDEEKALRIFDYIHENLSAVGSQVVDKDTWNDLIRSIAWCDQQSWDFATLLSKENIAARIVMLRDKGRASPHTIAEVFLGGRWIALDLLYGLVFSKNNGNLVTLEEISQDPDIVTQNPKVLSLPVEKRNEFLTTYAKVIPLQMEPKRWAPLLKKKNINTAARILNRTIEFCVRVGGKYLVYAYQDLYLFLESKSFRNPAEYLYFKARNYHLYGRISLADNFYRQVVKKYPQSKNTEDSQFFLGVLNEDLKKDYKLAIEEFKRLLENYPGSKWSDMAYYYLGKAYELTGNLENAKFYYSYSDHNLDTDAAWRLNCLSGRLNP